MSGKELTFFSLFELSCHETDVSFLGIFLFFVPLSSSGARKGMGQGYVPSKKTFMLTHLSSEF